MRWDHNITVVNGAGATPDPVATPATVPVANCFRLKSRNQDSQEINHTIFVALEAPVAETVDVELYCLNDDDDDNGGPPPVATARWSRLCVYAGLTGGRVVALSNFAAGAGVTPQSGGLFYLRVTAETVTADRLVQLAARPGGGVNIAQMGGVPVPPAGTIDTNLTQVRGVNSGLTADGYQGVAGKTAGGTVVALYIDGDGRARLAAEDSIGDPYPLLIDAATGNLYVGGDVAHDAAKTASPPNKQGSVARSSLPVAVTADDDIVEDIADRYGRRINAEFDFLNSAARTTDEDPPWAQKDGDPLVDVTNGVSGVGGAAVTYDYYFSPEDFGKSYLSWRLDGGAGGAGITMTIHMTAQDDGTAKESCDYDDVTNDLTGAATITAAAGASNDDYLVDAAGIMAMAKWIHVEVIVDATTATADWTIYKRQRYIG